MTITVLLADDHVLFRQGLALLVIDTKAAHSLVDGQYAQRRAACEQAAEALGVEFLADLDPAGLDDALAVLEAASTAGPDAGAPDAAGAASAPTFDGDVLARRTRHVVTEIARTEELVALLSDPAPLAGEKLAAVGALMDASHESLRVDYEVTCPELDVAVAAARAAGAHGARMTGGGFGGSAIALVDAGNVERVAGAVVTAYAKEGFNAPAFLDAVPSSPAGRLA